MKAAGLILALALGLVVLGPGDKAEAKTYVSFGFYGPGYYGYGYPYYGHHYRRDYFGPRYYYGPGPYYGPRYYYPSYHYGPRYYRPYRSYHRSRGGNCGYWAGQCGRNWGYNNPNFYGCMRYEGC